LPVTAHVPSAIVRPPAFRRAPREPRNFTRTIGLRHAVPPGGPLSKQNAEIVSAKIVPNVSGNPAAKLADAEMFFEANAGPLHGMKLIGLAVWERRTGETCIHAGNQEAVDQAPPARTHRAGEHRNRQHRCRAKDA
jgi:hypothetical protein